MYRTLTVGTRVQRDQDIESVLMQEPVVDASGAEDAGANTGSECRPPREYRDSTHPRILAAFVVLRVFDKGIQVNQRMRQLLGMGMGQGHLK
jgi:hypothetical protein